MSVDIIFKIAAIGIVISVLNHVLNRAGREEISMMVTLAGIVVVLLMVIDMINRLFNNVKSIFQLY
jgi:stage III sporulation protein AC